MTYEQLKTLGIEIDRGNLETGMPAETPWSPAALAEPHVFADKHGPGAWVIGQGPAVSAAAPHRKYCVDYGCG
jgi:hypothetical protein